MVCNVWEGLGTFGPWRQLGPTEGMWGDQVRPPCCPAGMAVVGLLAGRMGDRWEAVGATAETGRVVCGESRWGWGGGPQGTPDCPGFSSEGLGPQEVPEPGADGGGGSGRGRVRARGHHPQETGALRGGVERVVPLSLPAAPTGGHHRREL